MFRYYFHEHSLIAEDTGDIDIAWKVVRQKIETVIRQPSELDRETEELSEANFLGRVVAPWYRQVEDVSMLLDLNLGYLRAYFL